MKDLWRDLLMKMVTSKQLAKIWKSWPEAGMPEDKGFVKRFPYAWKATFSWGDPLTNSSFPCAVASQPDFQVWASGRELIIFIRRSFHKSFISRLGGSRARSQGFGHRFGSDYDSFANHWILNLVAPGSSFKVLAVAWKCFCCSWIRFFRNDYSLPTVFASSNCQAWKWRICEILLYTRI